MATYLRVVADADAGVTGLELDPRHRRHLLLQFIINIIDGKENWAWLVQKVCRRPFEKCCCACVCVHASYWVLSSGFATVLLSLKPTMNP